MSRSTNISPWVGIKLTTETFPGARGLGATNLATSHFRDDDGSARISKSARFTKTASSVPNSMRATGIAMETGRKTASRDFASSRAFLDQGKSLKALTIDQVRELLNKNK